MRRTIFKWFWLWEFEKEEKWLNEMASKGLALAGVGLAQYTFEESSPGEYTIRLEMLKDFPSHPESQRYIRFLEETGAEHIATLSRWVYFRKKAEGARFNLFSDIDSRIRHLNRMLWIPGILGAANLFNAVSWSIRYFSGDSGFIIALLCGVVAILMIYGFFRILLAKQKLKKERLLHE